MTLDVGLLDVSAGTVLPEDFAGGLPTLPAPWVPYTQEDFLTVIKKVLPYDYWNPLEQNAPAAPGWELLQQFAAEMAFVANAVGETWIGMYVLTATGGAKATVTVTFSRENAFAGALLVRAGTIVSTANKKIKFRTLQDALLPDAGPDSLGPIAVTAEAVFPSADWNVLGPQQTAGGETIPGNLTRILTPITLDPTSGEFKLDLTLTVEQVTNATGGQSADLDLLGADRGITRQPGDTDASYRQRIRLLQNQITPNAMTLSVNRYLAPWNITGQLIEPCDVSVFGAWNGPTTPIAGSPYDPTLPAWYSPDDTPSLTPFKARWLTEGSQAAYFIFVVPNIPSILMMGGAWDFPLFDGATLLQFRTSLGMNSVPAWNLEGSTDAPPAPVPGDLPYPVAGWDGYDAAKGAVYSGLYALIRRIKAAGIGFSVELEGVS